MTSLLHRFPDDGTGFQRRLQFGQFTYLTASRAAQESFAEQYVGG
jgi:hypothetical protein